MTERNKKDGSSVFKIIYKLRSSDGSEFELLTSGGRMAIFKPDYPDVTLPLDFRGLAAICFMLNLSWVNEEGSTNPCLLPLEEFVAEIQQYKEEAVQIIHLPTARKFLYRLKHRVFIDEDTGQKAEDMPAGGLYMDSPLRPEKFTRI